MNNLAILAQAAETPMPSEDIQVVPLDFIWEQITSLSWFQAVVAISFGVVYLLYGWRIFKVLVVVCFALAGLFFGIKIGAMGENEIWGGIIGLIVLAALSIPLMKWCVCILGAVAGGVITAGLWYAFELPQMYIWAGAVTGIVAGGMISFIVFKFAVMLFTSLGGSTIVVVAALALLHLYETNVAEPATTHIQDVFFEQNWFLPVAVMVPTLIGLIMQNKFVKHSDKWEL